MEGSVESYNATQTRSWDHEEQIKFWSNQELEFNSLWKQVN